MAPIRNGKVVLNARPVGYPEPGKTIIYDDSATIDLDNIKLGKDEILLKTICLSIDPYMRGLLNRWELGSTLQNFGISLVIESNIPEYKKGDYIHAVVPFAEYNIINKASIENPNRLGEFDVIKNEEGLPWSAYTGIAGMPGQTAYFGWKEHSKAKKGETIYVSTGAGAVGSIVVQLAKQEGLRVIASTGSDSKVQFLKEELGVDVAFNYKKEDVESVLKREGPIDLYWDNVGRSTLDAAIGALSTYGRIIVCGSTSKYNDVEGDGSENGTLYKNLHHILYSQLSINGFSVLSPILRKKYTTEFYETFPKLVKEGKFKFKEDVMKGLDKVGGAIRDQQMGKNEGKSVIVLG